MTTHTIGARTTLRALFTVTLYIFAAASVGTGLALVAEAKAVPLSITREG